MCDFDRTRPIQTPMGVKLAKLPKKGHHDREEVARRIAPGQGALQLWMSM